RLICEDEAAVAVNPVGGCGAVAVFVVVFTPLPDAFTSIATSSHKSPPPLVVHLQVTEDADARTVELDAPVITLDMLMCQSCVQCHLDLSGTKTRHHCYRRRILRLLAVHRQM